jgi:hypothetical protein
MDLEAREETMHNIVAWMRFPGPNYLEVLRWLHEELKPASYLEIGVFRGRSLSLAKPPTIALGIDPCPKVDCRWPTETRVLPMTSSEFFRGRSLAEFFGTDCFSLALVDGLHRFEQALDDIFSLEAYAQPDSVIAVHDTIPLDEKTASPTRCTRFHTGDVWKVVPFLKQFRADLEIVTVRTGPSGLTLIRCRSPLSKKPQTDTEALARFRELPWAYYKQHGDEFLETIPNEREAVARWLSGGRCQPLWSA